MCALSDMANDTTTRQCRAHQTYALTEMASDTFTRQWRKIYRLFFPMTKSLLLPYQWEDYCQNLSLAVCQITTPWAQCYHPPPLPQGCTWAKYLIDTYCEIPSHGIEPLLTHLCIHVLINVIRST